MSNDKKAMLLIGLVAVFLLGLWLGRIDNVGRKVARVCDPLERCIDIYNLELSGRAPSMVFIHGQPCDNKCTIKTLYNLGPGGSRYDLMQRTIGHRPTLWFELPRGMVARFDGKRIIETEPKMP